MITQGYRFKKSTFGCRWYFSGLFFLPKNAVFWTMVHAILKLWMIIKEKKEEKTSFLSENQRTWAQEEFLLNFVKLPQPAIKWTMILFFWTAVLFNPCHRALNKICCKVNHVNTRIMVNFWPFLSKICYFAHIVSYIMNHYWQPTFEVRKCFFALAVLIFC